MDLEGPAGGILRKGRNQLFVDTTGIVETIVRGRNIIPLL